MGGERKGNVKNGNYASERYNPKFGPCGQLVLSFNGKTLTMTGGKKKYSYDAVSGKKLSNGTFDYSEERQRIGNVGPIPAGRYWIRPDELWENAWYKSASTTAWGNYRISIHPFSTTKTYGRGGFFIHGGSDPGSAGCIDLTSDMDRFQKNIMAEVGKNHKCYIELKVQYP